MEENTVMNEVVEEIVATNEVIEDAGTAMAATKNFDVCDCVIGGLALAGVYFLTKLACAGVKMAAVWVKGRIAAKKNDAETASEPVTEEVPEE